MSTLHGPSDAIELEYIIKNAENIVFFGGAGVSTESGIPDFRGSGGLYTEQDELLDVPPETALSIEYLRTRPEGFFEYYRRKMVYPDVEPCGAHRVLAELERMGKLSAVITQNIDGLHQAAGSRNVIELHGSTLRNYCTSCGRKYPAEYVTESCGVPGCNECGGIVRPDVVLYGEALDAKAFYRAEEAIYECDVLIVGGTSLTVYPAASLIDYYQGDHLIIINKSPTPYDSLAEYVFRESISEVLERATKNL